MADGSGKPKKSNPTIYDLAEQLGVSASTVSRALAGSPSIGAETRKRVLEAAKSAKYVVNVNAKKLRQGRSRTIEVVSPPAATGRQRLADPFYLDMLAVVADELTARKHDLLITQRIPWLESGAVYRDRVDGLIIIGQGREVDQLQSFAEDYENCVVWGAHLPGADYVTVGSDNLKGGYLATQHLINLGREKIGFIGDFDEPEIQQRHEGYKKAMADAGRSVDHGLVFNSSFDVENARIAAKAAVATSRPFDALFCGSDVIALSTIEALRSQGKSVPEDVAIVGYDDISLASSFGQALTTVSQNIPVGGVLLVDLLFKLLEGNSVEGAKIQPELKVRETCGAYRRFPG